MKAIRAFKTAVLCLTMAAFCACGKDYDDSEIKARLEKLESTGSIASIEKQISSINKTIDELKQADARVDGIIAGLDDSYAPKSEITKLKNADELIAGMLAYLQEYVDQQDSIATDWVSGTFATLLQYEQVTTDIAALQTMVNGFSSLETQITSVKQTTDWICNKLDGYYDIAQTNALLDDLKTRIDAASMADSINISNLKDSMECMKTSIRKEYMEAIEAAISENQGVIDTRIDTKINIANTELKAQISDINKTIQTLKNRISEIEEYLKSLSQIYLQINLDEDETVVHNAGDTIVITYALMNASENAQVTASSDGYYKVIMQPETNTTGKILAICPTPYQEGFINIMGYDSKGFSCLKVVHFYQAETLFTEGQILCATRDHNTLSIPVATNFSWVAEVAPGSEWIHIEDGHTRASLVYDALNVSIDASADIWARTGTILLYPATGDTEVPFSTIQVYQASTFIEMEAADYTFNVDGGKETITVKSTEEFEILIPDGCDWFTVNVEPTGNTEEYKIAFDVAPNNSGSSRYANIDIITTFGSQPLGKFHICQVEVAPK